jgi:hypothetical protein
MTMKDNRLDQALRRLMVQFLQAKLSLCRIEQERLGKCLESPESTPYLKAAVLRQLQSLREQAGAIDFEVRMLTSGL